MRYRCFCSDCLEHINMLNARWMGSWETEILQFSYLSFTEIFILSTSPQKDFLICSFVFPTVCISISLTSLSASWLRKRECLNGTLWQYKRKKILPTGQPVGIVEGENKTPPCLSAVKWRNLPTSCNKFLYLILIIRKLISQRKKHFSSFRTHDTVRNGLLSFCSCRQSRLMPYNLFWLQ